MVQNHLSIPEDYAMMVFERFTETMEGKVEGMGTFHVFNIIKGAREQYIFIVKDTQFAEILFYKTLGKFADNPDLNFTWTDVDDTLKRMDAVAIGDGNVQ